MASDPEPQSNWECGCSPDREQKQIHTFQGKTGLLKGPTNDESARDSEENVGPGPESVVPCDLATGPTGQRCDK
jgi:hypothetical protein